MNSDRSSSIKQRLILTVHVTIPQLLFQEGCTSRLSTEDIFITSVQSSQQPRHFGGDHMNSDWPSLITV